MIVQCEKCKKYLDDEFRTTVCPHEAFRANDGANRFAYHHESYLSAKSPSEIKPASWHEGGLFRCCTGSIPTDARGRVLEGEEGERRPCNVCTNTDSGVVFHEGRWMSPIARKMEEH